MFYAIWCVWGGGGVCVMTMRKEATNLKEIKEEYMGEMMLL